MLTSADEWGEGVSQKLTIVQQCWRGGKGISQMLCIGTNWREFYWRLFAIVTNKSVCAKIFHFLIHFLTLVPNLRRTANFKRPFCDKLYYFLWSGVLESTSSGEGFRGRRSHAGRRLSQFSTRDWLIDFRDMSICCLRDLEYIRDSQGVYFLV